MENLNRNGTFFAATQEGARARFMYKCCVCVFYTRTYVWFCWFMSMQRLIKEQKRQTQS